MKYWVQITSMHHNISEEWNLQLHYFKKLTFCTDIYEELRQWYNITNNEIKDKP